MHTMPHLSFTDFQGFCKRPDPPSDSVVLNSAINAAFDVDEIGQRSNARAMVVREKRIGPYTYVYLVETVREDSRVKQRIIRNLGRKEDVERRGDLDRLVRSAARLAQRSIILSPSTRPASPASAACASARRCCSSACGATPSAAPVLHEAARRSRLRVSRRTRLSSSPFCTGSWSPAPIAPAGGGRDDYRIDGVE